MATAVLSAPTFDLSAIMSHAWKLVRSRPNWRKYLAVRLKLALREAWASAKRALAAPKSEADAIRDEITALEAKDRWTQIDYVARKELDQKLAKALIQEEGGRICTVTFTKKDGSERVMKVQPAALKGHVKGEDASEAGRKAAATRAARHPHLLPVYDVEAQAIRSINLATVNRIAARGQVHAF